MQTGHVVGSCQGFLECDNGCNLFAPVRRPAARERSRTAGTPELTSDCSTLHPHARAAAPPSGRSFFLYAMDARDSSGWELLVHSREATGGTENLALEIEKGAGASPLFLIDAPKPVTESRIGSGHPGKPIL